MSGVLGARVRQQRPETDLSKKAWCGAGSRTKLVAFRLLIDAGDVSRSREWQEARAEIERAIGLVEWPPGSGSFTLYDQSGKKTGEGSGVKPIKGLFFQSLKPGWALEDMSVNPDPQGPGPLDATKRTPVGVFTVEWETGNISSSHRAMNKMALYLTTGRIVAGVLVVPTRKMYHYLTDRVGNWDELEPYFPLWSSISVRSGVLAIAAVEHDAVSSSVPRIPKGTNGRARA